MTDDKPVRRYGVGDPVPNMSRDLSTPQVMSDREAFAKASALVKAAGDLLWDAGRYIRATKVMGTVESGAARGVNYNVCRLADGVEDEVKRLDELAREWKDPNA